MEIRRHILSVIAPHSGSGKTTFVAHVVRHIRGIGCLKISPACDEPGPWRHESSTGGSSADGIEQDFFLEDPAGHEHADKDTALYLSAGAAHVERLRHRGNGLAAGLKQALKCFPSDMPIAVESSSAVRLLHPAAVVMVVRPPIREVKPATRAVLGMVTDLVVNSSDRGASGAGETERFRQEYPALRPQFTWWADLIREAPPREMLARLEVLLAAGSSAD